MIRTATLELARLLFSLAVVALAVSILLGYGSYRLLRRLTVGAPAAPVQAAAFATLTTLVVLVKAIQERES